MRILSVHNRYNLAGGEDTVFAAESELLRNGGHDVETFEVSNDAIIGVGGAAKAALLTAYNGNSKRAVGAAIDNFRPDVVHVHNFFPLLSPSVFDACGSRGVASVWTLHNFRMTCANGLLFRNGAPCMDCVGNAPLPAIMHACYRNSRPASAVVAGMIATHRALGTWRKKVDRFIALTEFAKRIFIEAGIPGDKIAIKANFISDPGLSDPDVPREGAIYVGRLSPEKGVATLVDAWHSVDYPLTIVGDGPERGVLEARAPDNVTFAGWQAPGEVAAAVARAQVQIIPSLWYENFPMTLVEANAAGTPVVASRHGALESIVEDGQNGALFEPGDPNDLANTVRRLFEQPEALNRMRLAARNTYKSRSAPDVNLSKLMDIYTQAIAERAK